MIRAILGWILTLGALALLYLTLYVGLRVDGTLVRSGHGIASRSPVLSVLFWPLRQGEGLGWRVAEWLERRAPRSLPALPGSASPAA